MAIRNAEKVANLLRNRKPQRFCDQCIADLAQLGSRKFGSSGNHYNRAIAQQVAQALAQSRQFRRTDAICVQCRNSRKVTWGK